MTLKESKKMTKEEILKKYYNLHEEKKYHPEPNKYTFSLSKKLERDFVLKKHDKMLKDLKYGLEIEDGWLKIVDYVCNKFRDVITINQIKQKLGSLKIYYSINLEKDCAKKEKIEETIRELEKLSGYVCELTGLEGKTVNGKYNYLMTLNPNLAKKFINGKSIEDLKDLVDIQERLKYLEEIIHGLRSI